MTGFMLADDLTGALDAGLQLHSPGVSVTVLFRYGRGSSGRRIGGLWMKNPNTDAEMWNGGLAKSGLPGSREEAVTEEGEQAAVERFVVLDTESRNVGRRQARKRVETALEHVRKRGGQVIYKKVDSTLRGNIAAELSAMLRTGLWSAALFAPALPAQGRCTRNGIHYLDGVPIEQTELVRDPRASVRTSSIHELLGSGLQSAVGRISLDSLSGGVQGTCSRIRQLLGAGAQIIVSDAESDEHLQTIAAAVARVESPILPVGSAGLFVHLVNQRAYGRRAMPDRCASAEQRSAGRTESGKTGSGILIVCGSRSEVAARQLAHVVEHYAGTQLLRPSSLQRGRLDESAAQPAASASRTEVQVPKRRLHRRALTIENTLRPLRLRKWRREQSGRLAVEASAALTGAAPVLLAGPVGRARSLREEEQAAKAVAWLVGEVAARQFSPEQTVRRAPHQGRRRVDGEAFPSALVLVGGDTAFSVCSRLGAWGIEILGQVEPYVPLGRLVGGLFSGLPVVTKAGSFGDEESLVRAIEALGSLRQSRSEATR